MTSVLSAVIASEAKQSIVTKKKVWIASSLPLLAMTKQEALHKLQNQRVHRQRRAGGSVDLLHGAVALGAQHVLHFHCLDHRKRLAGFDLLAFADSDRHHSPGIGHSSFLPVSAADVTGISRAAVASLSVKTLTGTSKP